MEIKPSQNCISVVAVLVLMRAVYDTSLILYVNGAGYKECSFRYSCTHKFVVHHRWKVLGPFGPYWTAGNCLENDPNTNYPFGIEPICLRTPGL